MRLKLRRCTPFVCVVAALTVGSATSGWARQESPQAPISVEKQATSVVANRYVLNPTAVNPKTGKPLASDGRWLIGKVPPASCPRTKERCLEVSYEVTAESVRCVWAVLLNADGTDGKILDENDDAERYMRRKVSQNEARALVNANTRYKPIYPPIAVAAQVNGTVVLDVLVDQSGKTEKILLLSGPAMVRQASIDAARLWTFKPMTVGARAVQYELQLVFTFQTRGPGFASVEVAP